MAVERAPNVPPAQAHPLYVHWHDIWRFYELSYIGGAAYIEPDIWPEWTFIRYVGKEQNERAESENGRLQSFLFPYAREQPPQFEQRKRRSWYRNLCQPTLDSVRDHALGESVDRDPGTSPAVYAVWQDVDLMGSTMDEFMREGETQALVFGASFCVVDLPRFMAGEVRTLKDEQSLGVRPYATWYTPLQVPNWTVDRFGDLERLCLLEQDTRTQTEDPWQLKQGPPPVWRILYRDHWEVREGGVDGKIIDEGPNPLGRVPVEVLYAKRLPGVRDPIGQSFLHALARINQQIFNWDSMLDEITFRQGPFLAIPGGEKLTRAEMGLESAFAVPVGASPPAWVTLPADSATVLKERIAEAVLTMRAIAGLSRGSGEESIAARSGEALLVETQDKRAMLKNIRHECEDFERRFAQLVADVAQQTWGGHVKYSDQFFVRSFKDEVDEAKAFLSLPDVPDAVKQEIVHEVVRKRLRHMDPEEVERLLEPPPPVVALPLPPPPNGAGVPTPAQEEPPIAA